MMTLRTDRMTLSPCCPADREEFRDLERDPEVMHFLNGGMAVQDGQRQSDVTFLMPEGTEDYVWTARVTANRAFVGWFCLWPESEAVAELGYRLRRATWGKGLATEGALALVSWGFRVGGYDRVFAGTSMRNLASRRVLEKIGMTCVDTFGTGDGERGPVIEKGEVGYVLMRADWRED